MIDSHFKQRLDKLKHEGNCRAGADMIVSYFAKQAAEWLR
jgi:delta-aminolevulinic acid dehydratase/porphobilinogen synthase